MACWMNLILGSMMAACPCQQCDPTFALSSSSPITACVLAQQAQQLLASWCGAGAVPGCRRHLPHTSSSLGLDLYLTLDLDLTLDLVTLDLVTLDLVTLDLVTLARKTAADTAR